MTDLSQRWFQWLSSILIYSIIDFQKGTRVWTRVSVWLQLTETSVPSSAAGFLGVHMTGLGPSKDQSHDRRRATGLPARAPFLPQQLVSLLAPAAWIRDPVWTDWPVDEDHSQKNSAKLPPAASTTLALSLSLLPVVCADFPSNVCRGRAEDLENMSSWARFQTQISGSRREWDTYSYKKHNATRVLTSMKG